MKIATINEGKIVFECSYEDRHHAKKLGLTWCFKTKRWFTYSSRISYEVLKDEGFLFPSDFEDEMKSGKSFIKKDSSIGPLKTESYKHQRELTNLVLERKQCFFLCGVGTGKSKAVIDAFSLLYAKGKVKRCLVVTPASIIINFKDEVKKHSDIQSIEILGSVEKRKKLLESNTPIHIINYEILDKLKSNIIKNKYDMIIFDECHRLKSRTAKCSKAAYNISKGVEYKIGLTGTLFSNNAEDVYMPYKIISPEIFGTKFYIFKNNFLIYGGYNNYEIIGTKNEDKFQKLIASNSLKYDLDDIVDLPKEVEIIKKFKLNIHSEKIYKTVKKESVLLLEDGDAKVMSNALERALRLSQICSGFTINERDNIVDLGDDKIDVLKSLLCEIKGKVIVWCRFTHSVDRVKKLCDKLNIRSMCFDGRTKDKGLYKEFNSSECEKVWIAQIQTGIGYSIPSAKYSIFFETDYSRVNHIQAKGRNRRLSGSEKGSCIYIYLQAEKTIEEKIFEILKEKDFKSNECLKYIQGTN